MPVVPTFTEAEARRRSAAIPCWSRPRPAAAGAACASCAAPEELPAALASARREAQAGFGDDRVFIERFLPRARHIEVQILADAHGNVIHLGERECSLQRRHQKVIEESPSPVVDADAAGPARRGGGGAGPGRRLRRAPGTVEFIAAADDPAEHYFLEMNARLQVEHPVTELVTGLDLVEHQLRIAAGEQLGLTQAEVRLSGHAIEARINAEDAQHGFLPTTGTRARLPATGRGARRRRDRGRERGRHRL